MWMKYSNDTIGNQTRDLPACGAVPQPTEPPCAHWRRLSMQCITSWNFNIHCAFQNSVPLIPILNQIHFTPLPPALSINRPLQLTPSPSKRFLKVRFTAQSFVCISFFLSSTLPASHHILLNFTPHSPSFCTFLKFRYSYSHTFSSATCCRKL